jgi:hypothetical protein
MRSFLLGTTSFAAVLAIAGCSADTSTAGGLGSADGGGGDSSNGAGSPNGGQGQGAGTPFSCDQCEAPDSICVDETSCSATCPGDRAACNTSADAGDPGVCCASGEQCCTAAANGYTGGDLCAPADGLCPGICPDGSTCSAEDMCALVPEDGSYTCVAPADCNPLYVCGELCCPLGSTCGEDGSCVLADLAIDAQHALETANMRTINFQEGSCSFAEGCVEALGQRDLLRFSLRTPNIGDGDLFLGDPTGNALFVYSSCHDHYHFEGYANYRLLDMNMNEVARGHKQAFCLLDWEPYTQDAAQQPKYDCDWQGIQKGWADTYEGIGQGALPCQWVDVTDVPPGDYLLEITLNIDHTLGEKDYSNNMELVPITLPLP